MGVSQQAERAQRVALAQLQAQPQQLDLSGMALSVSPRLWPNRRVATLLVGNNICETITNMITLWQFIVDLP